MQISSPQSVQSQGIQSIAASNTTYSSGLAVLTGSNMITVKSSGAGQTIILDATQSVQVVQSALAASNTTYTSGLVTITGVGGGVTVSSNTGQRIDISVAAPVAQTAQTGISGIAASNTTYTSGSVTITGVGGGVTVSSNTGQRIDISVAAQSVQVVQSAIGATNTTYTSGLVVLTGSNMVTVKSSGAGQTVIIDATQTVQTQNMVAVSATNTLYSSGTVLFTGSNMITVKSSGAGQTIILDATQSVQVVQSALAASNTTYTSGVVSFTGVGGGVTVSSNTGQRVDISVATPINFSAGVSNLGNTAGSTGISGTRMVLVGSQNISLSQSTDANGATVSISGGAGAGAFSAGVSTGGNTAGATGVTGTQIVFVGTNGITLSQTTGAAGATISISGGAGGGGGVNIAVTNTTYTSGTVVFSASDGSRSALSMISTAGGQSVILTDPGPHLDWWRRGQPLTLGVVQTRGNTLMTVFPLMANAGNRFDGNMTANVFRMFLSYNQTATASISAALSSTMRVFVYTRTSNSISLLNSGSMSFGNTAANANNSSNWNGIRQIDISATSAWSAVPNFVYGGEYWIGVVLRTNVTEGVANTDRWVAAGGNSNSFWPVGSIGEASNASRKFEPFLGVVSLTAAGETKSSMMNSQITGAGGVGAQETPYVVMIDNTVVT